jgi:diadenylate cyclase
MREALAPIRPAHQGWREKVRLVLVHRWRTKIVTLCLVSLIWLILAGQQNFEATVRIPVETRDLPSELEIVDPQHAHVQITVRGLRKDASTLAEEHVVAAIDLSHAYPGKRAFAITRNLIQLPDERLQLVDIEPQEVVFTFQKRPEGGTLSDR